MKDECAWVTPCSIYSASRGCYLTNRSLPPAHVLHRRRAGRRPERAERRRYWCRVRALGWVEARNPAFSFSLTAGFHPASTQPAVLDRLRQTRSLSSRVAPSPTQAASRIASGGLHALRPSCADLPGGVSYDGTAGSPAMPSLRFAVSLFPTAGRCRLARAKPLCGMLP